MKKIFLVFTLSSFISCGPSLCDCVELDQNETYGGSFMGNTRTSKQKSNDYKFEDCSEKFEGMESVRRRASECD